MVYSFCAYFSIKIPNPELLLSTQISFLIFFQLNDRLNVCCKKKINILLLVYLVLVQLLAETDKELSNSDKIY